MNAEGAPSRIGKLLVIGYLILLINSSYLAAFADPTLFYFGNVAFHLLFGVVLTIIFALHALKRFASFSPLLKLAVFLLGISAALCLFLIRRHQAIPLGFVLAH